MVLEVVAAIALAILVLWLVFEPSVVPASPQVTVPPEPEAPEETRRGVALLALKEIEFDRATGKLSDRDYEMLKSRYAAEALAALDADTPPPSGPVVPDDPEELIGGRRKLLRSTQAAGSRRPALSCIRCGPRPEPDARFCSRCGLSLQASAFCAQCGTPVTAGSRFCAGCGNRIAA